MREHQSSQRLLLLLVLVTATTSAPPNEQTLPSSGSPNLYKRLVSHAKVSGGALAGAGEDRKFFPGAENVDQPEADPGYLSYQGNPNVHPDLQNPNFGGFSNPEIASDPRNAPKQFPSAGDFPYNPQPQQQQQGYGQAPPRFHDRLPAYRPRPEVMYPKQPLVHYPELRPPFGAAPVNGYGVPLKPADQWNQQPQQQQQPLGGLGYNPVGGGAAGVMQNDMEGAVGGGYPMPHQQQQQPGDYLGPQQQQLGDGFHHLQQQREFSGPTGGQADPRDGEYTLMLLCNVPFMITCFVGEKEERTGYKKEIVYTTSESSGFINAFINEAIQVSLKN